MQNIRSPIDADVVNFCHHSNGNAGHGKVRHPHQIPSGTHYLLQLFLMALYFYIIAGYWAILSDHRFVRLKTGENSVNNIWTTGPGGDCFRKIGLECVKGHLETLGASKYFTSSLKTFRVHIWKSDENVEYLRKISRAKIRFFLVQKGCLW